MFKEGTNIYDLTPDCYIQTLRKFAHFLQQIWKLFLKPNFRQKEGFSDYTLAGSNLGQDKPYKLFIDPAFKTCSAQTAPTITVLLKECNNGVSALKNNKDYTNQSV